MGKFAGGIVVDEKREVDAEHSQNPLECASDFTAGMNGFGFDHDVFVYQNKPFHVWFNGVIYNGAELRKNVQERGFIFETHSDYEVILALYVLDEEYCVHSLRGMFAFAIWNEHEETLFAARDPFGIKPFYYKETKKGLVIGAEVQPLMTGNSDSGVVQEAFQHYLTYQYVPEPYSLTKGIYKLKPGHYLIKKPGEGPDTHIYYRKLFNFTHKSFRYYVDKTRAALEDSVAHHMKADVPVGVFYQVALTRRQLLHLQSPIKKILKQLPSGLRIKRITRQR